jgi:hypothetical protein
MIEKTEYFDRLGISVTYWIGQNANDNFDILDAASVELDWWFHVQNGRIAAPCGRPSNLVHNRPSCHVIAHLPGKLDRKDLHYVKTRGAVLCREHSKCYDAKIICARVSEVTKCKQVGQVTVNRYILL